MVGDSPGRPRISVRRKLLLLLMENLRYIDDYEVPEILSQKGIGRELGLRQNHVSRALTELKEEGLVDSRTAHVKGVSRRRNIYFLTKKGQAEVRTFLESLGNIRLPVRMPDRKLKSMTLSSIFRLLDRKGGSPLSHYKLLTQYYDGSEVDLLSGKDGGRLQGPPISRYFFGREEELERLEMYVERSVPMVSIISFAGMGKTTLMGRFVSRTRTRSVDWTSMTEWTGPERLLSKWSGHLNDLGRTSLSDHLRSGGSSDPEESVNRLFKDLDGSDTIFVLDDYHRAKKDVDNLLSIILSRSEECGTTFIIGSRRRPSFYGKEDIMLRGRVKEIALEGLDKESSMKLLEEENIPVQDRMRIYDLTKGHPLTLELAAHSYRGDPIGLSSEVENYLGKELISGMNQTEKRVLFLAAAYEQPVVPDGLLLPDEVERPHLESLKEKMLLRVYPDGKYDIHDLIRYSLRKWMGEEKLRKYTKMALTHLSNRGAERDILHYMILLERIGNREELDRLVLDMGGALELDRSIISYHLRRMNESDLSGIDRLRYSILRADLYISEGKQKMALRRLEKGLRVVDDLIGQGKTGENLSDQISRIYNLKAEIMRSQGREREVISNHRENVRRMKKHGTRTAQGKALNNLALAYMAMGDLKKSLRTLERSLSIFEEANDPVASAFVEANLTEVLLMKRDIKEARKHLEIVDTTRIKSDRIEARLRRKTGRSRIVMKEWTGALRDLNRSYDCSVKADDIAGASLAVCDMAEVSIKTGDRESALSHLQSLIPMLDRGKIDDKHLDDITWKFIEGIHMLGPERIPKKLDEGLRKALYVLYEIETPRSLSGKIRDCRERYRCNFTNLDLLRIASALFEKEGEKHASVVILTWLGEDLIEFGKSKRARIVLKKARGMADDIGFSKAVEKTQNLLDDIPGRG
mgnify:FL=1